MLNSKTKNIIALILNAYLFISTVAVIMYGVSTHVLFETEDFFIIKFSYFRYFTNLSNFFAGLCAFTALTFNINNLVEGKDEMPKWIVVCQLISTSAVLLTFVVVLLFLAPINTLEGRGVAGYFEMFEKDMFFFHFFNPMLSTVIFIFFTKKYDYTKLEKLFVLLPFVVYAILYFIMVVCIKKWPDFYYLTYLGYDFLIPVEGLVLGFAIYFLGILIITLQKRVKL